VSQDYKCPNCDKRAEYEVGYNPNTGKKVCRKCGATVQEKDERGGWRPQ
jgi:transcription initiation factor TFIIIB Brf1 subunit/transcription initiation factor TFIIB